MTVDWKKRDTPTPMLLAVALLMLYAAGAGLVAVTEKSWLTGFASLIAAVAAVGTATLKPWSRFLVYGLAVALVGKLGYSIYAARVAGYFDGFATRNAALWSLVPGCVMAVLFLLACWIVHRQFSPAVAKPAV